MLSEKVCIVAGGGRGIGRASAVELASHGATVVVNDLGVDLEGSNQAAQPAEETIEAVRDAGGEGMVHYGDVASMEYTEQLVSDVVSEYGRIDGVVNFAGILRDRICYKMSAEEWDDVIRVHLRGHFALYRNVAAHWRERARETDDRLESQRSFLAVSSRSAFGNVGQANYSAAKAGVLGFVRATSQEMARYNVRINALMPSAFTRMTEAIPEEKRRYGPEEMPPEKIGPIVAFAMSDSSRDIAGVTLRAGGDAVGVVSDPEIVRLGYADDGWTLDELDERFRSEITEGLTLDRTGAFESERSGSE